MNYLLYLPKEITLEIFDKLSFQDQSNLLIINNYFYQNFCHEINAKSPYLLNKRLIKNNIMFLNKTKDLLNIGIFDIKKLSENYKKFYKQKIIDFSKFMTFNNLKLIYKNGDTYNLQFIAIDKNFSEKKFFIKANFYDKTLIGRIKIKNRPNNSNVILSKLFNQFVINNSSPNIMFTIASFECIIDEFMNITSNILDDYNADQKNIIKINYKLFKMVNLIN
ncbi:Hypothetical protein KVN_LOCUS15 [uncultured virus]|nr:Hypothetical protein KVN_LOCUS15 [uncultured virus]